jgi:DNA mismatch repair protein MutL
MIKQLEKNVYELIAAGEVIERPASVIKELVENSVDAGAKRITVEIKNGGITFMRVTDDGCGIPYKEVPLAFLRHATSKVNDKNDLNSIVTLGFRGEALASISAVARVEISTKCSENELGTRYRICGSIEEIYEETGCPNGSTIVIRDLFYNVPARKKFLKRESIEATAIINIVEKIALSHPKIAFQVINNGNIEWNTPDIGDLYSTVRALYGKTFADDLLPVDFSDNNVKIYGYTVKPLYAKPKRIYQNFFVNKRFVRSIFLRKTVEEAYQSLTMQGKFPAFVLFIDVDPSLIDVNIHPSKAEVRFANEKDVQSALYFAVKNAFSQNGLLYDFEFERDSDVKKVTVENIEIVKFQKDLFYNTETENYEIKSELQSGNFVKTDLVFEEKKVYIEPENSDTEFEKAADIVYKESKNISENVAEFKYITEKSFEEKKAITVEKTQPFISVIGEFKKSYILAETENGLTIIDKHAAHERVIYEELKNKIEFDSQFLMFPVEILLTGFESDAVSNNINLFENLGFAVDLSQKPYLKITAVPQIFEGLDIENVVSEIVKNITEEKVDVQSEKYDDIIHTMACKAAIKANDITSVAELQYLANKVYFDVNIRHCPHGRPILFYITLNEIEKKFKRII